MPAVGKTAPVKRQVSRAQGGDQDLFHLRITQRLHPLRARLTLDLKPGTRGLRRAR
tara:strand:+ start:1073 stop:1240 length:168 start_codon:yes stop_codon:yes gene_type:complete